MLKVDLITGFLGSGKTTFIKGYAEFYKKQGKKIRIIENELAPVSIDTGLLKNDADDIQDLTGKCMCCVGKDAFQNMLIEGAREGYDRIIVEPSGIYDVDSFLEVLLSYPVSSVCEIGSIITIVDACLSDTLSKESAYLLFTQIAAAGVIVLSKSQFYPDHVMEDTIKRLSAICDTYHLKRDFSDDTCKKSWDTLTEDDYLAFSESGYANLSHDRYLFQHLNAFSSYLTRCYVDKKEDLLSLLDTLFHSQEYGNIIRVKGLVKDLPDQWLEVNCTEESYSITPVQVKRGILVLIGEHLKEDKLMELFRSKK